jgi:hypothetical protein
MRPISIILLSLGYQTVEAGFLHSSRLSHPFVSSQSSATSTDLPIDGNYDTTTASNTFEVVSASSISAARTGEEYRSRLEATLSRLRLKDASSPKLSKEVSEIRRNRLVIAFKKCSKRESLLCTWFVGASSCV